VHSSWLARVEVFASNGLYSRDYPAAEDYEFLRRLVGRVGIGNVADCLLDYRVSAMGISVRKRRQQLFDRLRVQLRYFDPLEWRAWAGIMLTIVLFAVPRRLVVLLKGEWPLSPYFRSHMSAGPPKVTAGTQSNSSAPPPDRS